MFEIKMYTKHLDFEHEPISSATKPTTYMLRYKIENYIYYINFLFLLFKNSNCHLVISDSQFIELNSNF
jgi:hypothetical protein